jgi:hypothetical protein
MDLDYDSYSPEVDPVFRYGEDVTVFREEVNPDLQSIGRQYLE